MWVYVGVCAWVWVGVGVCVCVSVFGIVAETQGRRPRVGGRAAVPTLADPRRPCYFWDFFDPKWSKPRFSRVRNALNLQRVIGCPERVGIAPSTLLRLLRYNFDGGNFDGGNFDGITFTHPFSRG